MSQSQIYTVSNGPTYILPTALADYFISQPGGEPEHSLIEWVKENFLHPDWAFVDAGAHLGTYSLHFAPRVRTVYAFEPQRSTYHRLCGGVALNGYDNVHAFHTALGEQDGKATLRRQGDEGGLSTIAPDIPHAVHFPTEEVPVAMLDWYALEKIGLMKIDVEGSELAVLRGARQTLQRSGFPRLLIEVWNDAWFTEQRDAVKAELVRLGYRLDQDPVPNYPHMLLATHPSSTVEP